ETLSQFPEQALRFYFRNLRLRLFRRAKPIPGRGFGLSKPRQTPMKPNMARKRPSMATSKRAGGWGAKARLSRTGPCSDWHFRSRLRPVLNYEFAFVPRLRKPRVLSDGCS